jgi:hypothetical protein
MRVVYLAHPVSGDVPGNLARAKRWVRWIESTYPDVAVVAPWIVACEIWDDADPAQREAGMMRDLAVIGRCDELWLVGGRLSAGMEIEMKHAFSRSIPCWTMFSLGEEPPE